MSVLTALLAGRPARPAALNCSRFRITSARHHREARVKKMGLRFTWLRSARRASPPPPADQVDDFPQVRAPLGPVFVLDAARTYTGARRVVGTRLCRARAARPAKAS